MKTMDGVIEEELQSQEVKREDIEELNLDGRCRAKCIAGLDGCKSLKTLSLCYVGLTTLDGFPALPNLTELHLADNKISSGLGVLSTLTSLEKLNLVHNTILSMEELAPLGKLNIKWLDLFACPVENTDGFRDKVFGIIPSLEVLDNADRMGKENTDSDDESYVESEATDGSEGEPEGSEGDEDDAEDEAQDDVSKEAGNDDEENDGANGDESEAEKIDLSMLVEGPPVEDSDRDVDYHEDVEAPSSEDVDEEDDADLDNEDSETDRGVDEPSGVGPSSTGQKKRKREDDDEDQAL